MKKQNHKNERKNNIFAGISITVVSFASIIFFLTTIVYGWFVFNNNASSNPISVPIVEADTFDILVSRRTTYDGVDNGEPLYPGVSDLKSELADAGFSSVAENVSVSESGKLAFELVCEYEYDRRFSLKPDAYGYINFYIKPKNVNEHITVNIQLEIGGYGYQLPEHEGDPETLVEVEDETTLNLLKGHILTFENRSGANSDNFQYTNLIEGTFSFDSNNYEIINSGDYAGCYEVTIYWEWPLTYSIIHDGIGERYPQELETYINNNRNYFFVKNQSSNSVEKLNYGYDDADQTIGSSVDMLVVYFTIE